MKSKKRRRIGRLLTYCMFILIGVASVSVTSKAETSADGFEYEVNDDDTATITGYTGSETTLIIPGGG